MKHPSALSPQFFRPRTAAVALAAFAVWNAGSLRAETITVDPGNCVIVAGSGKLATGADEAVAELQKHLALVTGREIPVTAEVPKDGYAFFVGTTPPGDTKPLAPEEARWQITSKGTYFYGDSSSAGGRPLSFAVDSFLEEQVGVRWIEPGERGIAFVPQSQLKLPEGSFSWAPELLIRKIRTSWRLRQYPDLTGRDYVRDFKSYVRTNDEHDAYAADVEKWQRRMRMGGHSTPRYSHAFTDWWKKYGKDHPEYFAMLGNGRREPRSFKSLSKAIYTKDNPRPFQEVKMCASSPGLVEQIIRDWNGRGEWINVCENDGAHGFCTCEECRKLDVPQAGEKPMAHLTDRYVHLANAVAREARKINPNSKVTMYGYNSSLQPPRREKLEPNVAVAVVPTSLDLEELEALYDGWSKAGAQLLVLRPNYPHYYDMLVIPAGSEEQMFNAFQIGYRHGVRGADYDALCGQWPVSGFSEYVLANAFSEPDRPFSYWVEHYCSAFGPASGDVNRYFQYWRDKVWNQRISPNLDKILGKSVSFARRIMPQLDTYFQTADFDQTDAILSEAANKNLDSRQRARLEQLVLANQHARMTFNAAVAPRGLDKDIAAIKLLDLRQSLKEKLNLNWIGVFSSETRFYGDVTGVGKAAALRQYDLPWVDTGLKWRFKMDPENVGQKEGWQKLDSEETQEWDKLRADFNWKNAYDSETEPQLLAKVRKYDGVAWYGQSVTVPQELNHRRVFLYIGGMDGSCEVYVNGKLAGSRDFVPAAQNGPFAIEIGQQIEWSRRQQEITLRVENKGGPGGLSERPWIVSNQDGAVTKTP